MREDADLHDLVELRADVLVGREVLLHSSLLSLEVLTRIQIVPLVDCMVVVWIDSSSVNFDRGNYVVGHSIAVATVGVLDHGNHSVAVEVSLVRVPVLLLLRNHLIVVIVWHLVL